MAASSPSGGDVPCSQARSVSSLVSHASAICHAVSSNAARRLTRSAGAGRVGRGLAMRTSSESNRASTIASTPVRAAGGKERRCKAFALHFAKQHHMKGFFHSLAAKTVRPPLTCAEGCRVAEKNASYERGVHESRCRAPLRSPLEGAADQGKCMLEHPIDGAHGPRARLTQSNVETVDRFRSP